jgi:hypothetical protein
MELDELPDFARLGEQVAACAPKVITRCDGDARYEPTYEYTDFSIKSLEPFVITFRMAWVHDLEVDGSVKTHVADIAYEATRCDGCWQVEVKGCDLSLDTDGGCDNGSAYLIITKDGYKLCVIGIPESERNAQCDMSEIRDVVVSNLPQLIPVTHDFVTVLRRDIVEELVQDLQDALDG